MKFVARVTDSRPISLYGGISSVCDGCWRKVLRLPPLFRSIRPILTAHRPYLPAKDSAALADKPFDLLGLDSIIFISCQSYGNSFPHPRHAT